MKVIIIYGISLFFFSVEKVIKILAFKFQLQLPPQQQQQQIKSLNIPFDCIETPFFICSTATSAILEHLDVPADKIKLAEATALH